MSVPSQSHGYCQANLPVIPPAGPALYERSLPDTHDDNANWLGSYWTATGTIGDRHCREERVSISAADNFVARGHATSALPRNDALASVLAMQQGSDLVVGLQPEDSAEMQMVAALQPAALQNELHALIEANQQSKVGAASLVPLIEAVGFVLHVRGAHHGGHHLTGVVAGSNYSNTLVQLASFFEESMVALANARVSELVDVEVDELAARLADPAYLPQPASTWPAFTSLALYLNERFGHMVTVRACGVAQNAGKTYKANKPTRNFKVVFKWSGGATMGKQTELFVSPSDSVFAMKVALCAAEPSLSVGSMRLHVGGAPLGFNTYGASYDPSVDKRLLIGESGLAPDMEVSLCTVATAAGSIGA